jgi:hypothetical protein
MIPSWDQSRPKMLEGQHFNVVISDMVFRIILLNENVGTGRAWYRVVANEMKR